MKVIHSDDAPAAIGPYSQAIQTGNLLYASGQIPLDKEGNFIDADVVTQTKQVIENIKAVLAAANADLSNVVKTTVFLQDLGDFVAMNGVYEAAFGDHKPARSTIQVAGLPKGSKVEIEIIAEVG